MSDDETQGPIIKDFVNRVIIDDNYWKFNFRTWTDTIPWTRNQQTTRDLAVYHEDQISLTCRLYWIYYLAMIYITEAKSVLCLSTTSLLRISSVDVQLQAF
jgi:hypothetical protein